MISFTHNYKPPDLGLSKTSLTVGVLYPVSSCNPLFQTHQVSLVEVFGVLDPSSLQSGIGLYYTYTFRITGCFFFAFFFLNVSVFEMLVLLLLQFRHGLFENYFVIIIAIIQVSYCVEWSWLLGTWAIAALSGPAKPFLSLNPEKDELFRKDVEQMRWRPKKQKQQPKQLTPGVIYVGHLPPTLYETQILAYFSQFGTVTKLRLSRTTKTGNSKGYALMEFESEDVAKIVAETINNYLFGERLLQCHFMPPEQVHEELFQEWYTPFKNPSFPAIK
ncbi:MKI67 FHA domain-interacting nucleolar phosphoprotein-like [Suncus etruscus]|uniref:MKI67 FHA domain-interacting nucleolar phosphoprotein-like n=1 Tax=Suncus etruscus TaxID=109475 RepID=UPI00211018FD|nr:MKI67 FHA domain-interacting nucleolar phosphoprotein-like [Suncus etruscus]